MTDKKEDVHSYNVGNSNYADYKIQVWDIWLEYGLNPWDADIIKRTLRTKKEPGISPEEARRQDYIKIKHVCDERIRQLDEQITKQAEEAVANLWDHAP